jgi:hypothetical protein
MINNNPDKPWTWDEISCNPNITMEMINNNPDKPWDWWDISRNKLILQDELMEKRYLKNGKLLTE